ncbi:hypothetical protein CJD36_021455 [Flavipsychrobacter stenotrophus]|uniref:Uncharacterized protein n=1 Tax=Flavipsychrobacter stenotrophus TaxID=2077091 RepID=A0A2S7SPZ9_9BACT|nr:hypothetical protein [Flavipsychrobacter stenotrophus]PQJ08979.1 hypothetical protein CJD36_021455 [Flavipsychrobacter stenotrophus]
MVQQSEIVMIQGCFQSEHAKGLIMNLIKDKIQIELKSFKGDTISEDYLQYDEERRTIVEEELKKALDKIGDKRVNLHAIIVVEPLLD